MKVLVNREYIDLSLVKSISILNKTTRLKGYKGKIGFVHESNQYYIENIKDVDYYCSFTINYLTSSPYTVQIFPIDIDFTSIKKAIGNKENFVQAFENYWKNMYTKQMEEQDRKIEEEYNKLIEMWSESKPSDIIKFNFE
jgi:hypothetical protein